MEFLRIWEILLRRKWTIIILFVICFTTLVLWTHIVTPTYKATAKLLVETSDTLSSLMTNLGLQDMGGNIITTGESYSTDIALAKIKPLLKDLISSLSLKDGKGEEMKIENLVESSLISKIFPRPYIDVNQYEEADILEITSISTSPSEAANMSNKLAELYIQNSLERTKEEYKSARIFIERQIKNVKEEYYKSLTALKDFRIRERAVDLTLETQNTINRITTLKSNNEDNEKTIIGLEKEITEVENRLAQIDKFRKESEEYSLNTQLQGLKGKLSDLLVSIASKSIDISKEHPQYLQLEREMNTVKELMKDEATIVLNSKRFSVDPIYSELSKKLVNDHMEMEVAKAKRKLLKEYIDEYQDKLLMIPLKDAEGSKLQLSLLVNKDMYQSLLEYMIQVGIAESMTLSNMRLVEHAEEPEKPYFPKKPLNYVLGILLGLFWGLAFAFFKEYIDNTVKSLEDLKRSKSFTVLGTIPKSKYTKNRLLISELDPASHLVEAYRTIRNSIQFASVDKHIRTIAVTSSIEFEGKSSVASNLSLTFSMEDKKTLLVDLDLRRPSLKNFFDTPSSKGITNVLAEGMELNKTIIHTNIEGLDFLPSGPVPPDPSRLIGSQRLKDIIEELGRMYDTIVIDTPPVMAVNDSILIGTFVDGLLFIVESRRATFSMVNHAQEEMTKAGINVIGAVLNKVKIPRLGSYHYYYYYGKYTKK